MFAAASLQKTDAVSSSGASVPTGNNAVIAHFSDTSEPCHRDSGHYFNIKKVIKMGQSSDIWG